MEVGKQAHFGRDGTKKLAVLDAKGFQLEHISKLSADGTSYIRAEQVDALQFRKLI